jgi:hypothetical protein
VRCQVGYGQVPLLGVQHASAPISACKHSIVLACEQPAMTISQIVAAAYRLCAGIGALGYWNPSWLFDSQTAYCSCCTCSVEPCTSSIEGDVLNGAAMLPHLCCQYCCASVKDPQPSIGEAHLRSDNPTVDAGQIRGNVTARTYVVRDTEAGRPVLWRSTVTVLHRSLSA